MEQSAHQILFMVQNNTEIWISAQPERTSIDDATNDFDSDFADKVRRRESEHGQWGWCTIEVRAIRDGVSGTCYAGRCSYKGVNDFAASSHCAGMIREALRSLEENTIQKEANKGTMDPTEVFPVVEVCRADIATELNRVVESGQSYAWVPLSQGDPRLTREVCKKFVELYERLIVTGGEASVLATAEYLREAEVLLKSIGLDRGELLDVHVQLVVPANTTQGEAEELVRKLVQEHLKDFLPA